MSNNDSFKSQDPWGYYNGIAMRWLAVTLSGVGGMILIIFFVTYSKTSAVFFLVSLATALAGGMFMALYLSKRDKAGKLSV